MTEIKIMCVLKKCVKIDKGFDRLYVMEKSVRGWEKQGD